MLSKFHFYFLLFFMPVSAYCQTDTLLSISTNGEIPPKFPGGDQGLLQFLNDNLKYPTRARENGISGTVYVRFIIDSAGNIVNPEVLRGVSPDLDEEALRLVQKMPKWQPAIQLGKPVKVVYTMPLQFKLEDVNILKPFPNSKTDSLDASIGVYFGAGFNVLAGSITDYIGSMSTIELGTHFAFRRLNFLLSTDFSFRTKTKQDFVANGYWRKGRNVGFLSPKLIFGYSAHKANGWELIPYAGLSLNAFLPSRLEDADPKNGFNLDQTTMTIGTSALLRYNLKDRGPNRFNTRLLRFNINYNYLKFNDFLKGSSIVLTIGWGTEFASRKKLASEM